MATQFYAEFNQRKNELEELTARVNSPEDKLLCLEKLEELSQKCKQTLYLLPQYDQKIYNNDLQLLSDKIENASVTRPKKFSFKSRARQAEPVSVPEEVQSESTEAIVNDAQVCISDIKDASYTTEVSKDRANLKLENISNSVIVLKSVVYSVAKVNNIRGSTIFIRNVDGPVYLTGVHDSTIVISCHQFRMHESRNNDIYISCRSKRPIIENCSDIRFGSFPRSFVVDGQQIQDFEDIDDFNWIRKSQSVNWSRIESTDDSQLFKNISQYILDTSTL